MFRISFGKKGSAVTVHSRIVNGRILMVECERISIAVIQMTPQMSFCGCIDESWS